MTAMNLSLREVAESLTGARLVGDGATLCARVHSDTRSLQPGDLFVALKGERFDAASFLPDAAAKGAVAALCDASAAAQLTAPACPAGWGRTRRSGWVSWRASGAAASPGR